MNLQICPLGEPCWQFRNITWQYLKLADTRRCLSISSQWLFPWDLKTIKGMHEILLPTQFLRKAWSFFARRSISEGSHQSNPYAQDSQATVSHVKTTRIDEFSYDSMKMSLNYMNVWKCNKVFLINSCSFLQQRFSFHQVPSHGSDFMIITWFIHFPRHISSFDTCIWPINLQDPPKAFV